MVDVVIYQPGSLESFDLGLLQNGQRTTFTFGLAEVAALDGSRTDYFDSSLTLTYSPDDQALVSGTISRILSFDGDLVQFDISGLALPVSTLLGLASAHDSASSLAAILVGDDHILGSPSADTISGGSGFDYIDGGRGADLIDGNAGSDTLAGDDGADTLRGMEGGDQLFGGNDGDSLNGNAGDDTLSGGAGADSVYGGQGNDQVAGGEGEDWLQGNLGDDTIFGGDGSDTVHGGQGADVLRGEEGDDVLSGDIGSDLLYGGLGTDQFVLHRGGGHDWVADFNADIGERIVLSPGAVYTVVNYEGQALIELSSGDSIGLAGVSYVNFDPSWIVFR